MRWKETLRLVGRNGERTNGTGLSYILSFSEISARIVMVMANI